MTSHETPIYLSSGGSDHEVVPVYITISDDDAVGAPASTRAPRSSRNMLKARNPAVSQSPQMKVKESPKHSSLYRVQSARKQQSSTDAAVNQQPGPENVSSVDNGTYFQRPPVSEPGSTSPSISNGQWNRPKNLGEPLGNQLPRPLTAKERPYISAGEPFHENHSLHTMSVSPTAHIHPLPLPKGRQSSAGLNSQPRSVYKNVIRLLESISPPPPPVGGPREVSPPLNRAPDGHPSLSIRDGRDTSPRRAMAAQKVQFVSSKSGLESLATMKRVLNGVSQEVKDDHAAYVKDTLMNALNGHERLQAELPDFTNEICPFAHLKAVKPSAANSTISLSHYNSQNTLVSESVVVTLLPYTKPIVPRHKFYTPVDRSFFANDSQIMTFTPYLGDTKPGNSAEREKWLEKFEEAHEGKRDPGAIRKSEIAARITPYLDDMLDKLSLSKAELSGLAPDSDKSASFRTVFESCFGIPLSLLLRDDGGDSRKNREPSPKPTDVSERLIATYVDLGCMACGIHECQNHGEPDQRCNLPFKAMLGRHEENQHKTLPLKDESQLFPGHEPCSAQCFLLGDRDLHLNEWTQDNLELLQTMLVSVSQDSRAACCISSFMEDLTCLDIYLRIRSLNPIPLVLPIPSADVKEKPPVWYDNKTKRLLVEEWGKFTMTHRHDKRSQPSGCHHEGRTCAMAGEDCSCITSKVLCEAFCSCAANCRMRFTGCTCSSPRSCASDQTCLCRQLNRECTPGLCHGCDAATSSRTETSSPKCQNCSIQRGHKKKLLCGESEFGLGLFAAENISKGSYIEEYVGELISFAESQRRQLVNDEVKLSYLFDLNETFIIDAMKFGNLTRFINHSSKNHVNLDARVLLVNLEHRIGFFALKDIPAGAELFFYYGEAYATKYGLKAGGGNVASAESSVRRGGRPRGSKNKAKRNTARKSGGQEILQVATIEIEEIIGDADLGMEEAVDEDEALIFGDLDLPVLDSSDEYREEAARERARLSRPRRKPKGTFKRTI